MRAVRLRVWRRVQMPWGEYEKGRRKGKAEGKAEGKEVLQMRLNRAKLGQVGEAYARTYLESKGYQTLAVNYRCPYGEIDLIAREAHELVFIEIKSRTGSAYGSGFESITRYKRQHILRTACRFLAQQRKGQTNIARFVLTLWKSPSTMMAIR